MVRRTPLLALVLVAVLALAACGGDDKATVDLPGGGQVEIDQNDGGITIEGPTGTVQIGQAELPEGWPADFPLPDDAAPVYSVGAEGGVSVWFATAQSTEDLTGFFSEALPAAGYTIDSTTEFSDAQGAYAVMVVSGNGMEGAVYLGGSAAGTAPGFEGEFDFWVTLSPTS
jgi:hypothetical protein